MKLIYWGRDSGLAEKVVGRSPVEIVSSEEECRVLHALGEYCVRVARLLDKVTCPNCGSVNNFDAVRTTNMSIAYCECLDCHCEVSNNPDDADGVHVFVVDQDEWDTIVFGLCVE